MNPTILNFVNVLEGWKTAIKSLHWNSNSISQHEKCDDIAEEISEFQDVVSEVEQSISGNLPYNKLKGTEYKISSIQKFLEDVISDTTKFYKALEGMGDKYIGLHSECESFLTKIQRLSYLINFTLKENFKRQYVQKINESLDMYDDSILEDAKDALEMSDGQIDFYEWSDAYQEEDEETLLNAWNQACDETGYEMLKEAKDMKAYNVTENDLYSAINEAMNKVVKQFVAGSNKKAVTLDEAIDKTINNYLKNL